MTMTYARPVLRQMRQSTALASVAVFALTTAAVPQADSLGLGGFAISINDRAVIGTPAPFRSQAAADRALQRIDATVTYDGLENRRLLNVSTADLRSAYRAGEQVAFRASSNYPAYIARGEVQIVDRSRAGQPVVAVVPIAPNGQASWTMPSDGDGEYAYTLKVYDAQGRTDETKALGLTRTDRFTGATSGSPFVAAGEGEDRTAVRRIPVSGGTITAAGSGTPGGTVRIMGETVPVDRNGKFAVTRILPSGDHVVDVTSQGQMIRRDVNIPASEWFYVGIADLTAGIRLGGPNDTEDRYVNGRLAYYLKGKTEGGWTVTSSLDTRDGPIEDIFTRLNDKDPRRVLDRLRSDGRDLYPTYGDDSVSYDDTPTSGAIYVRLESDTTRFTFGNFTAGVQGPGLLNNTRDLYGAELRYQSPSVTTNGDPRFAAAIYAAQQETIGQRDILRGTGGSVYFLTRQDVTGGSVRLSVQTIDPDTGFVVGQRELVEGTDYSVDHIQGVVLLNAAVNSAASDNSIISDGAGEFDVNLIAQYEYTPTSALTDANAIGGRAEAWVTDNLRIGGTMMTESTSVGDQQMAGADVRLQAGNSFAELEIARTDGPGLNRSTSTDGGLTITSTGGAVADEAKALSFRARADLQDLGLTSAGYLGLYYEQKDAGFSTLTQDIAQDQTLIGAEGEIALNDAVSVAFSAEKFDQTAGQQKTEAELSVAYQLNDAWKVEAAAALLDQTTPGNAAKTGGRTDVALRATYTASDDLEVYAFGQATVSNEGGLSDNNRYGVGAAAQVSEKVAVSGEVSGGDTGTGAALRVTYAATADNEVYLGYTLDPTRTGAGSRLSDNGTIVAGGRFRHSESISTYAENIYDMPGNQRSLTQAYGVTYTPTEAWTVAGSVEKGTVRDATSGDFDRTALSFGAAYAPNEDLSMRARLEYRTEDGAGTAQDRDTWGLSAGYANQVADDWRLLANVEALYSDSAEGNFRDGEYLRASLGYAYRPIDNERLNLLFRYTVLNDLPGEDQISANGNTDGLHQRSQVLSVAGSYDLNDTFTLGGKLGYRKSEVANRGTTDFQDNTATLAALRLDWHVVNAWDISGEGRVLFSPETETTETGVLLGVYRQLNRNVKLGVGYEWGSVSDDETNLEYDGQGLFLNLVGKF